MLESLRDPEAASCQALSPQELAAARDVFVTGGAEALKNTIRPYRWLSWGVKLPKQQGRLRKKEQLATFLDGLTRAARRWLADPHVTGFFFMNKPPGIRLRVETDRPERVRRRIERWLAERVPYRFDVQIYEPEAFQFGGEVGMTIAHRHFTSDSLAALQVLRRSLQGNLSAPIEDLSLLCISDLLSRLTEDSWEMWDIWSHLRLTGRLPLELGVEQADETLDALAAHAREIFFRRGDVLKRMHARDRKLIEQMETANESGGPRLTPGSSGRKASLFSPRGDSLLDHFSLEPVGAGCSNSESAGSWSRTAVEPQTHAFPPNDAGTASNSSP